MVIGFGSRVNPGCKVEVMENGGIKKKIVYSVSAATGTNTENLLDLSHDCRPTRAIYNVHVHGPSRPDL